MLRGLPDCRRQKGRLERVRERERERESASHSAEALMLKEISQILAVM